VCCFIMSKKCVSFDLILSEGKDQFFDHKTDETILFLKHNGALNSIDFMFYN